MQTSKVEQSLMESLEGRRLMSADGPRVLSATADNRGQVTLNFDQAVNPASLTTRSLQIIAAGKAQSATLAFNKRRTTLIITARVRANVPYRLVLNGTLIKGLYTGLALDGEFNRRGPSGNGVPGGNYDISTTGTSAEATFSTIKGVINVNLFARQTPKTCANFLAYANGGLYDNTVFDALTGNGLYTLRGGGFLATSSLTPIQTIAPIANESSPSNNYGTLATYSTTPGQTTSRWIFNTDDNGSTLDTTNTAFGAIADAGSYAVLTALKSLPTVTVGTGFPVLPVLTASTGQLAVSNLATVYRVAVLDTFYRTA